MTTEIISKEVSGKFDEICRYLVKRTFVPLDVPIKQTISRGKLLQHTVSEILGDIYKLCHKVWFYFSVLPPHNAVRSLLSNWT